MLAIGQNMDVARVYIEKRIFGRFYILSRDLMLGKTRFQSGGWWIFGMMTIFMLCSSFLCSSVADAQDVTAGDTVEFSHMGKTLQGTVKEVNRLGWPTVEFEYRGRTTKRPFPANKVKVVSSAGASSGSGSGSGSGSSAASQMREWVDATGKFKIQAKMLSQADGKVELEKSDGLVVTLPIDKLSVKDQTFLKESKASQSANPFAGGVMKSASGETSGKSSPAKSASPQSAGSEGAAQSGKVSKPVFKNLRTFGGGGGWSYQAYPAESRAPSGAIINLDTTFASKTVFHNRLAGTALSTDKNILAIGRTNPFDKESEFTVVDLRSNQAAPPTRLKLKDAGVFAVSPGGNYVVTIKPRFGSRKGSLDFWRHVNGKAKHGISWELAGFSDRDGFSPSKGKFVSPTQLLTVGRKIALWDIGSGESTYSIALPSGASEAAFGPSDKVLAVAVAGTVHIVDIATGQSLGSFVSPDSSTSVLSFSQSGQFLAGLSPTSSSIWVWDLEANQLAQEMGGPQVGSKMQWVGDRYLLVNGSLIDIELRAIVWQYNGTAVIGCKDGRFFTIGKKKLASLRLPHVNLDSRTAAFDPDQLLILKPGTQVSLDFSLPFAPADQKKIRDTLVSLLQSNQVTINQSASLKLVAKVTKSKTETRTLSRSMSPMAFGGEQVTYTPHVGTIAFVKDGKTLMTRSRRFGPSSVVSFKRGETGQQAVTRMSQPSPSFFTGIKLPKYLAALPDGKPLGVSSITENGIN